MRRGVIARRKASACCSAAARTLLLRALLCKAAHEHLHFTHRLFVALALGGGDAFVPGDERLVVAPRRIERLPEQFPRSGVTGIERDCAPEMSDGCCGITAFEILV